MAFVRKKATSYRWPVSVMPPGDGGIYKKETLDLEFLRLKRTELEEVKDNVQLLKRVVIGWYDYKDEDGEDIPFSATALEELLEDTAFVPAAATAFWESLNGTGRNRSAQEGN